MNDIIRIIQVEKKTAERNVEETVSILLVPRYVITLLYDSFSIGVEYMKNHT